MSTFSAEWLSLREGADERARNKDVANAFSAWFMQRPSVSVVDLGSGTGANLRAVAPLLRLLPGGAPLAAMADAFPATTDRLYIWVARNRGRLGELIGADRCAVDPSRGRS